MNEDERPIEIKLRQSLELEDLVELAVPRGLYLVMAEDGKGVHTNFPRELALEMLAALTGHPVNAKSG
jgi:hypothetical protein